MRENITRYIKIIIGIICIVALSIIVVPKYVQSETIEAIEPRIFNDAVDVEEDYAEEVLAEIERQRQQEYKELFEEELTKYLGDNISKVGLFYYNLESDQMITINEEQYFIAASTVKVPIAMVVADMLNEGTITDEYKIKYNSSDYEDGTGIMQGMDLSKPYDILTLMEYMIVYSDNIATNMIKSNLDYSKIKDRFEEKLGHEVNRGKNIMTPSEACEYLKQLYYNEDNNPYYDYIIELLKNTVFHDRLDANLEYDMVAHKIGNYGSYVNDIGIVYSESPYVIAIYTEGVDNANDIISEISYMIYEYNETIFVNN